MLRHFDPPENCIVSIPIFEQKWGKYRFSTLIFCQNLTNCIVWIPFLFWPFVAFRVNGRCWASIYIPPHPYIFWKVYATTGFTSVWLMFSIVYRRVYRSTCRITCGVDFHWKPRAVMCPTLTSTATLQVVITTTLRCHQWRRRSIYHNFRVFRNFLFWHDYESGFGLPTHFPSPDMAIPFAPRIPSATTSPFCPL